VLEAMALQLPVISHAVGGIAPVLGDGALGTLISDQEPPLYRDVLLELHRQPQRFLDMTKRAVEAIDDRYTAQHNAGRCVNLYTRLLGRAA
jgi:glycosyltransferase involved in cell wall biosynthesis